jgi:hypothetical protein
LPSDIPVEKWPSIQDFIKEAKACVKEAEEQGIILRVMGGPGVYIHINSHSEKHLQLWKKLGRLGKKKFGDIDFMSYGKFRGKVVKFFENRGYTIDRRMLYRFGKKRHIYIGKKFPMVDVFFDTIDMCHLINFKKRLEADYPTIPLAELILHKVQIAKLNKKDVTDLLVLIRAHEIGETDEETINAKYIAKILSKDWGFYYTTMTNLNKVKESMGTYPALTKDDEKIVKERIDKLINYIETEPKSIGWKLRAKIGTRTKWYNEVEEWDVIA